MMKARSPQCFDHGFYRDTNWDLAKDLSKDQSKPIPDEQLWHHFIHSGQFEARPHRWEAQSLVERQPAYRLHVLTLPKACLAFIPGDLCNVLMLAS